jgi:hypothetical protein
MKIQNLEKQFEVSDSHGYSHEDCCLLGYDSAQTGRYIPPLWTNLLPPCAEFIKKT